MELPGWPAEAKRLSPEERRAIRKMLGELHLDLPAMLEVRPLTGKTAETLERLKQDAQLVYDLSPAKPPVIETILGFKSSDWDRVKSRVADELVVVCFKPHAGQAVNSPERTLWLLRQVRSPRLRIVYDYSHFSLEGFPLAERLQQLLPYTPSFP